MSKLLDLSPWNFERYQRDQEWLQAALDGMDGTLADRISVLHAQQLAVGFIKDPLSDVKRCRLVHPTDRRLSFTTQYNPRRSQRSAGAGRREPPHGFKSVNNGCFLCQENIFWQQCGLEMGYKFDVNARAYFVWCNPFPLMRNHVTISSAIHEPQTWVEDTYEGSRLKSERIIQDLLSVVGLAPGYVGFYNGLGAGASIPGHLHYHLFERSPGHEPFPLEKVALRQSKEDIAPPFLVEPYPITSVYFRGEAELIREQAVNFLDEWTKVCGSSANLSANIIATQTIQRNASDSQQEFDLYFVPRNREYLISSGRVEVVGGLEALGEIAFSSEAEYQRLTAGEIDFDYVRRMLMSVEAPEAYTLIERNRSTLSFSRH